MPFLVFICVIFLAAMPAAAQDVYQSEKYDFKLVTVADELDHPWGVAFLPDGDYLVTEKSGKLFRIKPNGVKERIYGLPVNIVSRRQGGLLDIIVHPDFETNGLVYFSYTGRGYGGTGTEVARAVLKGQQLDNLEVLFKFEPKVRSDVHFGSRLLLHGGYLYITLGERFQMDRAQELSSHHGALIRLYEDGTVPEDNPFIDTPDALPEIYSYGHRNVQGIALQPGTERIWAHEHGPKGGDEVNIIKPGANYGWPVITYGIDYDGSIITTKTEQEGMEQPVIYWVPSIAPCGMDFYDGEPFPQWKGDIFVGALAGTHLRRLSVDGDKVTAQEVLLEDLGERIRDVGAGPDGFIYVLTDSHEGRLMRLEPANKPN